MEKNPDKRYQTIEEMLEELNTFYGEYKEGLSKTVSIFKLGRKQRKLVFRGTVIFLLAAIIGIYFWQSNVSASQPASIVLLPLKSITQDA